MVRKIFSKLVTGLLGVGLMLWTGYCFASEENVVFKNNFEQGVEGWQAAKGLEITLDTKTFHQGSKSIKISGSRGTDWRYCWSPQIPVSPNTTYEISVWVYVEEFNGPAHSIVKLQQPKACLYNMANLKTWQHLGARFTTREDQSRIQISFGKNMPKEITCTFYIDDITLTKAKSGTGVNLLSFPGFDPTFEDVDDASWTRKENEWEVFPTESVAHRGKRSLQIYHRGDKKLPIFVWTNIVLKPNTTYLFKGWVKTDFDKPAAKVKVGLMDAKWKDIKDATRFVKAPYGWEEISATFTTGEKPVRVSFYTYINAKGNAWFDDFSLEELSGGIIL